MGGSRTDRGPPAAPPHHLRQDPRSTGPYLDRPETSPSLVLTVALIDHLGIDDLLLIGGAIAIRGSPVGRSRLLGLRRFVDLLRHRLEGSRQRLGLRVDLLDALGPERLANVGD